MTESKFTELISNHKEFIKDRKRLLALLRDCFAQEKSTVNLLMYAYDVNVVDEIEKNDINDLLVNRLKNNIIEEFSVDKEKALWSALFWCKTYGINILNKTNNLTEQIDEKEPVKEEVIENIGIDLGTTNTVVSFVNDHGEVENLKISSKTTIPSVIFFDCYTDDTSKMYFGYDAIKRCKKNSQSVVKLFKRKIGNSTDRFSIIFNDENKNENTKPKSYVIDTNCFCIEPDILEYFNDNEIVYLPITVTNELQYRSGQQETQYSANKALENLASAETKYVCKILYEESDLTLLPKDFFEPMNQNDENDDKVLTVAIKHKDDVTLITNDNKLRGIKAPQCGVKALNFLDFKLDRLPKKQRNDNKILLTGEQAASYFLRYIRDEVCKQIYCDGLNAVITVPVNFNNVQVEATKRAAKNAGFREICIEKEPVAAAIAYSMDQENNKKILVYDFGGGTFDVAIVNFDKTKNEFNVISTAGNPELGGQDITDELSTYIKEIIEEDDICLFSMEDSGLGESEYYSDLQIVDNEAERVKQSLSFVNSETIGLSNLYAPNGKMYNKQIEISKEEFESVIGDIVRKPTSCIEEALKEAGLTAENIDVIIMSGGTSLMPLVKEKVTNFFGKLPFSDKNPATLIADGAALIANSHFNNDDIKKVITEPVRRSKVIADLGIATEDFNFDVVINRGSELPASGVKNYYLLSDNQKTVDIKVYSRKKNNDTTKITRCDYLDTISITNIPDIKRKDAVVEVSFELTKEYELLVSAEIKDVNGQKLVEAQSVSISRDSNK